MLLPVLLSALLAAATLPVAAQGTEWQSLFNGKSLQGWSETPFRGHGTVEVSDGAILLRAGQPLTGITRTDRGGELPKIDYEVRFEAMRVNGGDFFASLTLPVGDSFGTLVTGGWGGDIVGFSSIDGWDASDNETRTYFTFEAGQWYAFRIQITAARIKVWIGEKEVVNVAIAGRAISMRPGEIERSIPFGFASYNSTGALRKIEYRRLRP